MENDNNRAPVYQLEINDIVLKARVPPGDEPHPVFVLLHGWTGDETSMWIFASRLPAEALLLAPRGLYESPLGGYSWYLKQNRLWPIWEDFEPAIYALTHILSDQYFPNGDFSRLRMVGFSQGAALCYSFALSQAMPLRAIAGLSGFVPEEAIQFVNRRPLENLPIFVAHGDHDQLVPVDIARKGVELLQNAGALVSYCEHKAGHKLNAECFRSLQIFFQQN
jgi:phospholipase/carboxylesterase